jgi:tetratricopeptide (TPR) repeat protein
MVALTMRQASVILLLVLTVSTLGCARKGAAVPTASSFNHFDIAEKHYRAGNYAEALEAYQQHLQGADPAHRDVALFHMALSYALGGKSSEDLAQALRLFDVVASEYPEGEKAQQARLLSRSVRLIQQLQAERDRQEVALAEISESLEQLVARVSELERHREVEQSSPLRRASNFIREGRVKEAAEIYVSFLTENAGGPGTDEAAFRLALIYLSANSDLRDPRLAFGLLEGIVRDRPDSIFASQAAYLLSVHREVTRLRTQVESQRVELNKANQELQALKAIDLRRRQSETSKPSPR